MTVTNRDSFFKRLPAFSSPPSLQHPRLLRDHRGIHSQRKWGTLLRGVVCLTGMIAERERTRPHTCVHRQWQRATDTSRSVSRSVHDRWLLSLIVGDLAAGGGLIHSFAKVSLEGKSNGPHIQTHARVFGGGQVTGSGRRQRRDQSIGAWERDRGKSMHVNGALIFICRYLLWLQMQSNQKNKKNKIENSLTMMTVFNKS